MTKDQALDLMRQYAQYLKEHRNTWISLPLESKRFLHLIEMPERFPSEGSTSKAMRWLGFVQGALWMAEVFSLDTLKLHSKNRMLDHGERPECPWCRERKADPHPKDVGWWNCPCGKSFGAPGSGDLWHRYRT